MEKQKVERNYYLNGKNSPILDSIEETSFDFDLVSDFYEIII